MLLLSFSFHFMLFRGGAVTHMRWSACGLTYSLPLASFQRGQEGAKGRKGRKKGEKGGQEGQEGEEGGQEGQEGEEGRGGFWGSGNREEKGGIIQGWILFVFFFRL